MESEIKHQKNERLAKERKTTIIIITIIVLIVLLDQISKIIISNVGEVLVIEGILKFNISSNINNVDISSRIVNILSHIVILGIILKFMRTQNEFIDIKLRLILSFIFAGGFSNLIDRIFNGSVIEFIDFTQKFSIPIFNIADIFVLIGWIGIAAIFAKFTIEEWRRNKSKRKKEIEN